MNISRFIGLRRVALLAFGILRFPAWADQECNTNAYGVPVPNGTHSYGVGRNQPDARQGAEDALVPPCAQACEANARCDQEEFVYPGAGTSYDYVLLPLPYPLVGSYWGCTMTSMNTTYDSCCAPCP